jgi:hypothetical protein
VTVCNIILFSFSFSVVEPAVLMASGMHIFY